MDLKTVFTRDNLMKLFVLLVSLAFIFELFVALPNRGVQQNTPQDLKQNATTNTSLGSDTFVGTATINATIVGYQDSLVLNSTNISGINDILMGLIQNRTVLYKTDLDANTIVLNIAPDANVTNIVNSFEGRDVTIIGRAVLKADQPIAFTAPNASLVNVTLDNDLSITLDASNEVGSNLTLSLRALIDNGQIQQLEEPQVIPLSKDFVLSGWINNVEPAGIIMANVGWENRNLNVSKLSDRLLNITGKLAVEYQPMSVVELKANLTKDMIANISSLSYVINASDNIVTVSNDTTNQTGVQESLDSVLRQNILIDFPDSTFRADFIGLNATADNVSALFPNGTKIEIYRLVDVELPSVVSDGDINYSIVPKNGTTYISENGAYLNNSLNVRIRAHISGGRISDYGIVEITVPSLHLDLSKLQLVPG